MGGAEPPPAAEGLKLGAAPGWKVLTRENPKYKQKMKEIPGGFSQTLQRCFLIEGGENSRFLGFFGGVLTLFERVWSGGNFSAAPRVLSRDRGGRGRKK